MTLSATSLSFTGTSSGSPTTPQTITLTNTGNASLVLANESLSGADASYFGGGASGCANITLAPGGSCTTSIVFTPSAARTYGATLSFTDNAPNSPQAVSLSGVLNASATPVAKAQFGYVGGSNGEIYSFTISPSGVWTPTSPISVGVGDTFGAMVIDPLGKFLFVAGFLSGDVVSYSITPGTGTLVNVGTAVAATANNRPEAMTIDPTGRFLYVSNTGMGTVSAYTVNRSTGTLTAGAVTTVPVYPSIQAGDTTPGGIVTDASGKYLYVSEIGYVACYSIDQTTGAITPLATAPTVQGAPFFTLRLDPTGKFLYGTAGRSNSVSLYAIDPSTGALTTPSLFTTGNGAADIGITFDDTHAYVVNRDDGTISQFSVNSSSGALSPLTPALYNEPAQPYVIQIDPGDQLAYVARENAGLEVMNINADGTISNSSLVTIGDSAVGLAIYPTHP